MKWIFNFICFVFLITGCEKGDPVTESNSKIKTKYTYSNSTDNEPYSFTTYTYDKNWNVIKELISDYPKPIYASYTFEYSENGELLNKKYMAKEGLNHSHQTESDFSLIWEKKYDYNNNKKIEREFHDNVLTDSNVYIYSNNLLQEEIHYDKKKI